MSRASRAIALLQGLIKTVSGEAGVASALARPAIPCLASSAQHGLSAICRSVATGSAQVSGRRQASLLANLKQLSKFRLSSLVVLTASAGYVMGSGERVDLQGLLWTSLGTFGAAACANTLNQIYEVANDRAMSRTCNRPLPAGRMTRLAALAFAVAAGGTGLATLHYMTNDVTTALGAANILLYAGVYTPLKQISPVNTWVGAVVGAIPPLMGWASATHGQLDPGAFVLAAALFFWQLPHFLALSWLCKEDYIRGGFRMISALDRFGKRTSAAALRNAVYLLPLGAAAYYANVTTQPFAWEAAALGGMMLVPAARFYMSPGQQTARKLFKASLLYLPLTLAAMAVHRQPQTEEQEGRLTWEQVQAALQRAADAATPPAGEGVPLAAMMRASVERTALAAVRVFRLGDGEGWTIRCPSTVHSDDGQRLHSHTSTSDSDQQQDSDIAVAYSVRRVEGSQGGTGAALGYVRTARDFSTQAAGVGQGSDSEQQGPRSWRQGLDL